MANNISTTAYVGRVGTISLVIRAKQRWLLGDHPRRMTIENPQIQLGRYCIIELGLSICNKYFFGTAYTILTQSLM